MGGIPEVNSAEKIDQLEDLRFKMKSEKSNLSSSKSEKILENEMPGTRNGIPQEETFSKYGGSARKVEIGAIEKHGTCSRIPFSGIPEGGL